MDKESQSRGSVIALILVIMVAFALVNFDKVCLVAGCMAATLLTRPSGHLCSYYFVTAPS